MRPFHPRSALAGLLLIALLTGCGQKGPLFLPKPAASPPAAESVPPPPKP